MPGTLDPDDIIAITVTPPTKRLYRLGESLNLTGASVHIYYRGPGVDAKLDQEINPSYVSGFDSKKHGIQIITVTIGDRSDRFDIALMEPPISELKPLTALPDGIITISNDLEGSWKIYIFDRNGAIPKNGEKTGSESPISFQAPSTPADYTVVRGIKKDGRWYSLFYKLTVAAAP